jgi:hypothetical protein
VGRLGSRIRTVAPAFPAQGPANLAGMLAGTVVQPRRVGRNPIVRGRIVRSADDVPQVEFTTIGPPWPRPKDAGDVRSAPTSSSTSTGGAEGCTDCG